MFGYVSCHKLNLVGSKYVDALITSYGETVSSRFSGVQRSKSGTGMTSDKSMRTCE